MPIAQEGRSAIILKSSASINHQQNLGSSAAWHLADHQQHLRSVARNELERGQDLRQSDSRQLHNPNMD
jgi:hypothetical protein